MKVDDLVMAAQMEAIEHEGCGCGLCWALEAVDDDTINQV